MQRNTAVEFSNVFLALWAPQAECHLVQLNVREGGNLHRPISTKLSNLHQNNLDQGSPTSVGLRATSRKQTDMEGNLFNKITCHQLWMTTMNLRDYSSLRIMKGTFVQVLVSPMQHVIFAAFILHFTYFYEDNSPLCFGFCIAERKHGEMLPLSSESLRGYFLLKMALRLKWDNSWHLQVA